MSVLVYIDSVNGVAKNAKETVFYGSKIAAEHGTETIVITAGNSDETTLS